MAIPSLSGSYIDETYQRLVQTTGSGAEFADGLGNPITFGTIDTGSFATTGSNLFRGNQVISGSLTVFTGSGIELQVTNTGVRIGNALSDIHTVTGSLRVNGGITGSLLGTASFATTASFVNTASLALSIQGGSANYIPLWTSATTLGNSTIYQNGGNIGINTAGAAYILDVNGTSRISGDIKHVNNTYVRLSEQVGNGATILLFTFTDIDYSSVFMNYHVDIFDGGGNIIASRSGQIKASYNKGNDDIYYTENTTQDYVNAGYNISTEKFDLYFTASSGTISCYVKNQSGFTAEVRGEYLLIEKS